MLRPVSTTAAASDSERHVAICRAYSAALAISLTIAGYRSQRAAQRSHSGKGPLASFDILNDAMLAASAVYEPGQAYTV